MPVLSRGGAISIVAHQDDDILFMNPDIAQSIAQGEANTTIFVTAGDAGLGDAYWQGREEGAKAAYSVMTGHDEWVDETITIDTGSQSIDVHTSYLLEAPEIRLYFLRLPDGGGALGPGEEQQLARLESGELASVTTIDGESVYSRSDVVDVLTELLTLHEPSALRLQVHEGETAAAEHTDHTHTAEFSEEALLAYSGGTVQVTHYVHYDSRLMPANLTPDEAALSLEVMLAYAEHDPGVLDENGNLAEVYETWTGRQYIAESYSLDTSADDALPEQDPQSDWPGEGDWVYSLDGADAFLFSINAADGSVQPEDWFVPSATDAWDQNEDHVYEMTRVAESADGDVVEEQQVTFVMTADGVFTMTLGTEQDDLDDTPEVEDETSSDTDEQDGDAGPIDPDTGQDTLSGDDSGDTGAPTDVEDVPPVPDMPLAVAYSLTGDDAFLFQIDDQTGEVSPQAWFVPTLNDAWDQDEDHVYELIRVATPADGSDAEQETLRLETVADGELSLVSEPETEAPDVTTPDPVDSEPEADTGVEVGEDDTVEDPAPEPPANDGGGEEVYAYLLSGPDAQVFVIDPLTGELSLQSWFAPDAGDAWDVDEDNVYEISRTAIAADGSALSTEELRFEIGSDGTLIPAPDGAALMAALTIPDDESEAFLLMEDEQDAAEMDATV